MSVQPLPPIHRVTAQTSNYERRMMFGQTYERCLPYFDWRVVKGLNNVVK